MGRPPGCMPVGRGDERVTNNYEKSTEESAAPSNGRSGARRPAVQNAVVVPTFAFKFAVCTARKRLSFDSHFFWPY